MKSKSFIYFILSILFITRVSGQTIILSDKKEYKIPLSIYKGDTLPHITLKPVYVYSQTVFKNKRQQKYYSKLVRDVKKTLPLAKDINQIVIETYEYLQTLPDEKSRNKHIKNMEKGLKQQYTSKMKKLTFSQGKLLIKLVDRECNQSSFELVKAFMGPFKAGFYQTFAALFGASLKKQANRSL